MRSCETGLLTLPNLHMIVIQGVLKVKVKGHVKRALLWCHEVFAIQYLLTFCLYMHSLYEAPLHSPSPPLPVVKTIVFSSFLKLMQSCGVHRPSVCLSIRLETFAQIASTTNMTRSPPNLHNMVPTRACKPCIQDVLKVKVKGQVIWTLLWFHKNRFLSQTNGWNTTKLAHGCYPGCAQGQGRGQRSCETGTSVSTCTHFTKHHYTLLPVQVSGSWMSTSWNELLRHWRSGCSFWCVRSPLTWYINFSFVHFNIWHHMYVYFGEFSSYYCFVASIIAVFVIIIFIIII